MPTMIPYGNCRGMLIYQQSINVASVAAATTAEQTFAVPGLLIGDVVLPIKPSLTAGLAVAGAHVTATNTLAMQFVNATAAPIDPAAETYLFVIIRPDNSQAQSNVLF